MVRADSTANDLQPDDKKETTSKRKKAAQKKKDVTTGIWPCKINGCNKQFAREADLKRHQRTTKLHSMPGFACPQCDATFTRTDAQRRHQKSRHNGVVIESPGQEKTDGTEEASSSNQSRSRSGTPSRKGKEKATGIPVETHQGTPNVGGPSSYYRSHTATMTYVPPQPRYPPIGLPTSSARTTPNWVYPHNAPTLLVPMTYSYPPTHNVYYTPSPHYRTNGSYPPLPSSSAHPPTTNNMSASSSNGSPISPETSSPDPMSTSNSSCSSNLSTMEHCLSPTTPPLTAEEVEMAMQAVIKLHAEAEKASQRQNELELDGSRGIFGTRVGSQSFENTDRTSGLNDLNGLHGYGPPLDRPEPMEHILTEDGEPMLNPAELLTQESLASPPPS